MTEAMHFILTYLLMDCGCEQDADPHNLDPMSHDEDCSNRERLEWLNAEMNRSFNEGIEAAAKKLDWMPDGDLVSEIRGMKKEET